MYALANEREIEVTEKMKTDLDKMLNSLEKASGQIWIGKKDFLVRKLKLNVPIMQEGREMQVLVDMNVNEYNKDVEILKPEGAEEFKDNFNL